MVHLQQKVRRVWLLLTTAIVDLCMYDWQERASGTAPALHHCAHWCLVKQWHIVPRPGRRPLRRRSATINFHLSSRNRFLHAGIPHPPPRRRPPTVNFHLSSHSRVPCTSPVTNTHVIQCCDLWTATLARPDIMHANHPVRMLRLQRRHRNPRPLFLETLLFHNWSPIPKFHPNTLQWKQKIGNFQSFLIFLPL